jgi:hypothetical protein
MLPWPNYVLYRHLPVFIQVKNHKKIKYIHRKLFAADYVMVFPISSITVVITVRSYMYAQPTHHIYNVGGSQYSN